MFAINVAILALLADVQKSCVADWVVVDHIGVSYALCGQGVLQE